MPNPDVGAILITIMCGCHLCVYGSQLWDVAECEAAVHRGALLGVTVLLCHLEQRAPVLKRCLGHCNTPSVPGNPIINEVGVKLFNSGFQTCFAPSTFRCWVKVLGPKHISDHAFWRHFEKGGGLYNVWLTCKRWPIMSNGRMPGTLRAYLSSMTSQ